jgi:hypothetical protein
MSSRYIIAALALSAAALAACSKSEDAALRCHKTTPFGGDTFDVLFEPRDGRARLLVEDGPIEGSVSTADTHYVFSFPSSASRFAVQLTVQRLSGDLVWEHGQPPFGGFSEKNVRWSGRCEKVDAKPIV